MQTGNEGNDGNATFLDEGIKKKKFRKTLLSMEALGSMTSSNTKYCDHGADFDPIILRDSTSRSSVVASSNVSPKGRLVSEEDVRSATLDTALDLDVEDMLTPSTSRISACDSGIESCSFFEPELNTIFRDLKSRDSIDFTEDGVDLSVDNGQIPSNPRVSVELQERKYCTQLRPRDLRVLLEAERGGMYYESEAKLCQTYLVLSLWVVFVWGRSSR